MSNMDPRGVKRGSCSKCTCTMYEYEKDSPRAACAYCECPAPAHLQITVESSVNVVESPRSLNSSLASTIPSVGSSSTSTVGQIVLTVPSNVDILSSLLPSTEANPSEPTTDDIENELPLKFPKKVEANLKRRSLTANDKSAITQAVVDRLYSKNFDSNKALKKAATLIRKKYSPMKSTLDPDGMKLFEKFRRRRDRLNENRKTESIPADHSAQRELSPDEAATEMRLKYFQGERRAAQYEALMEISRNARMKKVGKVPALQIMRDYPALHIEEVVISEFEYCSGSTLNEMRATWLSHLPAIVVNFVSKGLQLDKPMGTVDQQTVSVLKALHQYPLWRCKKPEIPEYGLIMQCFETQVKDEMRPKPTDPPRVLFSGSLEGTYEIDIYVDSEAYATTDDAFKALILLLGAYYVFGIKWPPLTRSPLLFYVVQPWDQCVS